MSVFKFRLVPGKWYVMIDCANCHKEQVLFPDLTEGKSNLNGLYVWTCPMCGRTGEYDGEKLLRYQHQPRKKKR